ncbi:hypothetical protein V5P93_004744 [Actinokineospora auranticolor]|uniref:Uncharacterized protein n=1 Tax=Actinokineospora auranticolor TaxID=155976 RepID=A0A2S6GNF4_9PSEU|nr:hypothetical protein [Actinokineospora auranticolor]PPK66706.1 hypothetical protein CLV40_10991 [Actinokineospora auranticolor]
MARTPEPDWWAPTAVLAVGCATTLVALASGSGLCAGLRWLFDLLAAWIDSVRPL